MKYNEIWKPIPNFEELYEISNLGNVKSLNYRRTKKEHILKKSISLDGYYVVNLHKNKYIKNYKVHRLIAEAFIENPNNYPCINHIDGNKLNNSIDNLEWCTYGHNEKEAYRLGLRKGRLKNKFGKNYPNKLNIIGMYKNGILLEKFYGTGEIKRKYNYCPVSILDCCKGKYKKAYGYEWKFILELLEEVE